MCITQHNTKHWYRFPIPTNTHHPNSPSAKHKKQSIENQTRSAIIIAPFTFHTPKLQVPFPQHNTARVPLAAQPDPRWLGPSSPQCSTEPSGQGSPFSLTPLLRSSISINNRGEINDLACGLSSTPVLQKPDCENSIVWPWGRSRVGRLEVGKHGNHGI